MPTPHDHPDAVERACAGTAVHREVTCTSGLRPRDTDRMSPTDPGEQVVLVNEARTTTLNNVGGCLEPCAR